MVGLKHKNYAPPFKEGVRWFHNKPECLPEDWESRMISSTLPPKKPKNEKKKRVIVVQLCLFD
jgi:hypothetical protein